MAIRSTTVVNVATSTTKPMATTASFQSQVLPILCLIRPPQHTRLCTNERTRVHGYTCSFGCDVLLPRPFPQRAIANGRREACHPVYGAHARFAA